MVKIELQFTSVAEAVAFLAAGNGANTAAGVTVSPTKAKKETGAPKPDAKPQEEPAASGAQTATDSAAASAPPAPAEAAKAERAPAYEKSGIGEKINGYVGAKDAEGYAARRQNIIDLLAEFKVPNGKALAPEQFAPFLAKLNALIGPESALG